MLTDWKEYLIEDLYVRTSAYLETGHLPDTPSAESEAARREIRKQLTLPLPNADVDLILKGLAMLLYCVDQLPMWLC